MNTRNLKTFQEYEQRYVHTYVNRNNSQSLTSRWFNVNQTNCLVFLYPIFDEYRGILDQWGKLMCVTPRRNRFRPRKEYIYILDLHQQPSRYTYSHVCVHVRLSILFDAWFSEAIKAEATKFCVWAPVISHCLNILPPPLSAQRTKDCGIHNLEDTRKPKTQNHIKLPYLPDCRIIIIAKPLKRIPSLAEGSEIAAHTY